MVLRRDGEVVTWVWAKGLRGNISSPSPVKSGKRGAPDLLAAVVDDGDAHGHEGVSQCVLVEHEVALVLRGRVAGPRVRKCHATKVPHGYR